MTKITEVALKCAIQQVAHMDQNAKEAVCDEIFSEQPNLLASVLALTKWDISPLYVEVALEALMVTHVALRDSGERLRMITEAEQERELRRLTASVRFTEGLASGLADESIKQYIGFREEPWLFAYIVALLRDNGVLESANENSKYVVLAALNVVGCVANAQRAA